MIWGRVASPSRGVQVSQGLFHKGKMEWEIHRQRGSISSDADAEAICCSEERTEPEVKISIYRSIYVPTLTYGHKLWERLRLEPLLLCIERSHLRGFGPLVRMPPGCLIGEVFQACPSRRKPWGRPGEILSLGWLGNVFVSIRRS